MSRILASLFAGLFAVSVLAVTPAAYAASGAKPAATKQTKSGKTAKKSSTQKKKSSGKKSGSKAHTAK